MRLHYYYLLNFVVKADIIQRYMCPQFNFVVKFYLQRNGVLASKSQTVFSTTSAHNLIKGIPGSA